MGDIGQVANAVSSTVTGITSWMQFAALVTTLLFAALAFYLLKTTRENKKVIEANKAAEEEKTNARKVARDAEVRELNKRIDDHLAEHGKMETRIKESFDELKADVRSLKDDIKSLDRTIIRLSTIMEAKSAHKWNGVERREAHEHQV